MPNQFDIIREGSTSVPKPAPPLAGREHTFSVEYDAPGGQTHRASLTSRIADADARARISRGAAMLAAGPWEALPTGSQGRFWALANLSLRLIEPPEWVAVWCGQDDALLFALYEEVERHDRLYFRADPPEGSQGEARPRVRVAPAGLAGASSGGQ